MRSVKRVVSRPSNVDAPAPVRRGTDPQLQRVRAVATQAFFYVAAFMTTYLPAGIVRILAGWGFTAEDEGRIFPLLLIQSLLLPAQGFFNVLVYIRPSFQRTRRDYPNETRLWAFRRALYGEGIRPTTDRACRNPSSSDFGGLIVHRLEATRGGSVLELYGMAHMYPENYWRNENEDDADKQRRRSSEFLQDASDSEYRGPASMPSPFQDLGLEGVSDESGSETDAELQRSALELAHEAEAGEEDVNGDRERAGDSTPVEPPSVEENVK